MAKKKAEWAKIRADYETNTELTQVGIAEKHGVPIRTLRYHISKHNWISPRNIRRKLAKKAKKHLDTSPVTEDELVEIEESKMLKKWEALQSQVMEICEGATDEFLAKMQEEGYSIKDFHEMKKMMECAKDAAGVSDKGESAAPIGLNINFLSSPDMRVVDV